MSSSWTPLAKWPLMAALLLSLFPAGAQTDPDLASRIEKAFSDEPSQPITEIYKKYGLPTTAKVGDQASYLFVFLAMHESPDFRSKVLAKLRSEVKRGAVPRDALMFAEARDRLERIREQANARPPTNPGLRDEIEQMVGPDQAVLHETPIEDEAHVNERLAAIGAMRVELYARMAAAANPDCAALTGQPHR